jgi:hypothetical protein
VGFLDRLLGRPGQAPYRQPPRYQPGPPPTTRSTSDAPGAEDQRAIARYRYLLRTAPPEELERVHAEAFARLTPEQRQQVLSELSRDLPPGERVTGDDPQSLARTATRAELRQPGYLEQTFSRSRFGGFGMGGYGMGGYGMGGLGMGGTIMGSMMGTIAGVVIGSAVADALFDDYDSSPEASDAGDATGDSTDTGGGSDGSDGSDGDQGNDYQDAGFADTSGGAVYDAGDYGGGDFGGGDFGGDLGGGDFTSI